MKDVFTILGITAIVLIAVMYVLFKRETEKKTEFASKEGLLRIKATKKHSSWQSIFNTLLMIKPLRSTMYNLEKSYELMQPGCLSWAMKQAVIATAATYIPIMLGLVSLLVLGIDLYTFGLIVLSVFVLHDFLVNGRLAKLKSELQKSFRIFIENVRHNYYIHGMIDDAIYNAMIKSDTVMYGHARNMYDTITSDDIELALVQFNATVPDDNMKTFMAICVSSMENGDPKDADGNSVFITDLAKLKISVQSEILRTTKRNGRFKGLSMLAVIPAYVVPVIQSWASGTIASLQTFYAGGTAFIAKVIALILSASLFYVLSQMKNPTAAAALGSEQFLETLSKRKSVFAISKKLASYNIKKTEKIAALMRRVSMNCSIGHFFAKRILMCVLFFIVSVLALTMMHRANKQAQYIIDGDIEDLTGITAEFKEPIKQLAYDIFVQNVGKLPNDRALQEQVLAVWPMQNTFVADGVVQVISKHLTAYATEIFKWQEIFICLGAALIGYQLPYWLLLYKRSLIKGQQSDEILRFQTIILMLMNLKSMTSEKVLRWLADFAVLFKGPIQDCINAFSQDEEDALDTLSAVANDDQFELIIQNLGNADRVGLAQAFDELDSDREAFIKQMDAEEEISQENKHAVSQLLAMIPLFWVLAMFLVIPLVSMAMGSGFTGSLGQ